MADRSSVTEAFLRGEPFLPQESHACWICQQASREGRSSARLSAKTNRVLPDPSDHSPQPRARGSSDPPNSLGLSIRLAAERGFCRDGARGALLYVTDTNAKIKKRRDSGSWIKGAKLRLPR